jgi:hypothetical protein
LVKLGLNALEINPSQRGQYPGISLNAENTMGTHCKLSSILMLSEGLVLILIPNLS